MTMLNVTSNRMRLYEGIRNNVDGTNAGYQWGGWFDATNELHEIKHVVHFDIRIQVNEDVNKSPRGMLEASAVNYY